MKNADEKCCLHVPRNIVEHVSFVYPEKERWLFVLQTAIAATLFFVTFTNIVLWGFSSFDFIVRGIYFYFGNLAFPDGQYFVDTNEYINGQHVLNSYVSIHQMYEYWVSKGFFNRLIFRFVLPAFAYGGFFYVFIVYQIKKALAKMKGAEVKGGTE